MTHPNDGTGWGTEGGSEAALEFKEPVRKGDPNTGTNWGPPRDPNAPVVRIKRDIDKMIEEQEAKAYVCPHCQFKTSSEGVKLRHSIVGPDGLTACQTAKKNWVPVKECASCSGRGLKGRVQCGDCDGTGRVKSGEAPPPMDTDALAAKIASPIVDAMKQGFEGIALALLGAPAQKARHKGRSFKAKKGKKNGSPLLVLGGVEDAGPAANGGVGPLDKEVEALPEGPEPPK